MHRRIHGGDRLRLVVRRRRNNMHLVAPSEELLGKMRDVLRDAAGVCEVVWRDERKLHRMPLLTRANASGKRSIAPDGWRHSTAGVRRWPELRAPRLPSYP